MGGPNIIKVNIDFILETKIFSEVKSHLESHSFYVSHFYIFFLTESETSIYKKKLVKI